MFKNPFSFNGRIRRTEFGLSYLIYMVVLFVVIAMGGDEAPMAVVVVYIPLVWFLLAQGAKRCHDRGNSGWWLIIPFYVFWMLFADGQPGENQYGPDPKGRMNPFDEYDYYTKNTEADNINPPQE
jgi:uncharacterized membrane protein YhaH (DUF805 family)